MGVFRLWKWKGFKSNMQMEVIRILEFQVNVDNTNHNK